MINSFMSEQSRIMVRWLIVAASLLVTFTLGCWCGEHEARLNATVSITPEACEILGEISALQLRLNVINLKQKAILQRKTILTEDKR